MDISRAVKNDCTNRLFLLGSLCLYGSEREVYTFQRSSGDLFLEGKEAGKALVNLAEKLHVSVMASFLTMWQFWI